MNLKEETEIFDPAQEAQKSYDAPAPEFRSETLHHWTIARHSVALSLGCQIITAVGPFVGEFLEKGVYPNVYRDVVIVLWLCSLPDDEIIAMDVRIDVKTCLKTAYEWAESVELQYGSAAWVEGISILDRILKNVMASFFEIEQTGPAELKKKDIVLPGRSRSRGRPRQPAAKPLLTVLAECLWRGHSNGRHSTISPGASN